jgi:5-methylcytosine-specific restriction endonuclease McrA
MKVPINCHTCNIEFLKQECWIKRVKLHFCSKKCHDAFQTRSFKNCKICGDKFKVSPVHLKRYSTCSKKECRTANKLKENNPNWRGGVAANRNCWEATRKAKNFKKLVLKRDKYTCQECKQRGGDLEVHHKKPWSFFPELRCDINNGVTLCIECHKKTFKSIKTWRLFGVLEKIKNDRQRELRAEKKRQPRQ